MTTDRFSTYGALIGTGITSIAGKGLLPGLLLGFTSGTVAAGYYNAQKPKVEK
jgi:hypothetical protein